jgi:CheY-like chemotaxis protein
MSAYAEKAAYQHGLVQASEMFLQKPFNEETLLRKIGQVLELNKHS